MATITVNTYLDGGTARTAGEAWTMNGGVLTIRTDTRWHLNAPASYLGSIGATTISATLGGGVSIDATKVRWLAITGGSGTPAIGDTVSQGGVTGYYLGYYANLTSAPTLAIGATGFIKLREVNSGAFAAGALTFSVAGAATAAGADVTGWIEVVQDIAVANVVPRLGSYKIRGDWFYLDNTNGSAAQTIQVPTNGGGANTNVPGVWIETAPLSNTYEFYTSVLAAVMIAANFGTDARSKIVQNVGGGLIRIGNNGTANVGFVPPSGCRVRIPNVLGRQTSSVNRALNLAPHATIADRPDWTTTSAGLIDFEYFMSDWYHLFASPYQVIHKNCATFEIISVSNLAAPLLLDNCGIGNHLGTSIPLTISACSLGGTISNSKFHRVSAGAGGYALSLATSAGLTISNCEFGIMAYTRNATGYAAYINQCLNLTITNCKQYNGNFYFNTSFTSTVTNLDHVDRYVGTTNSTTGLYAVQAFNSSDTITVDGVTFGLGGTIANCQPYAGIFNAQNSSNLLFKNVGTTASPVNGGSANQVGYIYVDSGVNTNVKVQRCYLTVTRTAVFLSVNTSNVLLVEHCVGTVGAVATAALNANVRSVRNASYSTTGQASCYGSHAFSMFYNDTTGAVFFAFNEPTATSAPYVNTVFGTAAGFTSGGQAAMPNLNDSVEFITPYFVKGFTAFTNSAPVLTGTNTGNFTYTFDIDTGAGWSGSYTALTGANLNAKAITASTGFRLKVKAVTSVAASTNALTYIALPMTTTLSAQNTNLYPLVSQASSYSLTGLAAGTTVVLFNSSNVEINRQTIVGTTYDYNYVWDSTSGDTTNNYLLVWKNDKVPFIISGVTLGSSSQSVPVTQASDRVYGTATSNATIDFTNKLIIMAASSSQYDVAGIYSLWKNTILLTNNAQYQFAFSVLGGDSTSGVNSVPFYTYLINNWRVRPDEASHTLEVINGVLLVSGGGDPFVNTLGSYVVRINYQQPVQAIAVSTSGGGGATAAEVWGYATRALSATGVAAIQSGLATIANQQVINTGVQNASISVPHSTNI
jgi:hypothetical protein